MGRRRRAAAGPRAAPARLAAFAVGVALVLGPVVARNYAVSGGVYLTTSQFGPNFYIGNNPGADGSYAPLRFGRGSPEFERLDATELAERAAGRPLTPAEVSGYWTSRALDFIRRDPGAWLALEARKAVLLVNAAEMIDTESQESHAEWSWPLRLLGPLTHFGVLVPLAVAGVWLTWRGSPPAVGALRDRGDLRDHHGGLLRLRALPLPAGAAAGALRRGRRGAGSPRRGATWPRVRRSRAGRRGGRHGGDLPVAGDLDARGRGPSPRPTSARRCTTTAGSTRRPRATGGRSRSPRLRAGVQQPRRDAARAGPRRRRDSRVPGRACALRDDYPDLHYNLANALLAQNRRRRGGRALPPRRRRRARFGRGAQQPWHRAGREGPVRRSRGGVRAGAGARADLGAGAPESRQRAGDAGPARRTRSATCSAPWR